MRIRRAWKLSKAAWAALPTSEKDELLIHDEYRQRKITAMREAIGGNEHGPMDAAWAVLLALEQI